MENVSKIMMLAFSTVIFAAAIVITMIMYTENFEFIGLMETQNSYGSVMAGD
ncbi:MAG: hypothetical protein IJF37_01510 [Lachnospiraceae bacterium]|nr:hypothetical protein [Lachnospiraceae bacterium]